MVSSKIKIQHAPALLLDFSLVCVILNCVLQGFVYVCCMKKVDDF